MDYCELLDVLEVTEVTKNNKIRSCLGLHDVSKFITQAYVERDVVVPKELRAGILQGFRDELNAIREHAEAQRRPSASDILPFHDNSTREFLSKLVQVRSFDGRFNYFDQTTGRCVKIDSDVYETLMAETHEVKKETVRAWSVYGDVDFNPKSIARSELVKNEWGIEITLFNSYNPPSWRSKDAEARMPEDIRQLLQDHFCEDDESLDYLLTFFKNCILERNHTMLALLTAKGTGKELIVSHILAPLVGLEYVQKVNESILTEKFNDQFFENILLFMDEVDLKGEKRLNKIKAFLNDRITHEGKGKDAKTIKNHCSIILASNNIYSTDLTPDWRRVSILNTTQKTLLSFWGQKQISDFVEKYPVDPTEVHPDLVAFGNYVMQYKSKYGHNGVTPFKGRMFYDVCWNSMKEYQSFLVEMLISNINEEYILYKDVRKAYENANGDKSSGKFMTPGALTKFLDNYLYDGVNKFATRETRNLGRRSSYKQASVIIPTPEFKEHVLSGVGILGRPDKEGAAEDLL